MALFVKQDEERSELQQKVAADIAERQRARAQTDTSAPDGVEDSRLVEGTSRATRTGVIMLVVLIVAAVAIVIYVSTR